MNQENFNMMDKTFTGEESRVRGNNSKARGKPEILFPDMPGTEEERTNDANIASIFDEKCLKIISLFVAKGRQRLLLSKQFL
jgi:hypothetical protein